MHLFYDNTEKNEIAQKVKTQEHANVQGPQVFPFLRESIFTDKKENQIFLIFKEIRNGAVAKAYMTNNLTCS
jgi:hypothetical protein